MKLIAERIRCRIAPFFVAAALLTPSLVDAQSASTPADLAILASNTVADRCADLAGNKDMTVAAESSAEVSDVWLAVSKGWDESRSLLLIYWRGVLAQCLGRDERAAEDLQAFVQASQSDAGLRTMSQDARRRLRRIERRTGSQGEEKDPVRTLGWALLGGGLGAAGAGAAMHFGTFDRAVTTGGLTRTDSGSWTTGLGRAEWETLSADLRGANRAGFGLLLGGAVAGAIGIVAVSGAGDRAAKTAGFLVPTPSGGFVLVVGGTF